MREILHCLNILLFIIFYKKSSKSLTYLYLWPTDFVSFFQDLFFLGLGTLFWLLVWLFASVLFFTTSEALTAQIWATLITAWVSSSTDFWLCFWKRVQGIQSDLLQKTGIPAQHWGHILTLACLFCMLWVKYHINQKKTHIHQKKRIVSWSFQYFLPESSSLFVCDGLLTFFREQSFCYNKATSRNINDYILQKETLILMIEQVISPQLCFWFV